MSDLTRQHATTARGRESRTPKTRGIYVLLNEGPSRRAILYSDPDPLPSDE